jgi:hypothetical protein
MNCTSTSAVRELHRLLQDRAAALVRADVSI